MLILKGGGLYMNRNAIQGNMKKRSLPILALSILLITTIFYTSSALAATPVLNKSSVNLHIEQGCKLKIKGFDKKLTIKWSTGNKNIASISDKGSVTGLAKGKTVVYAKIYNKNKLKYTLKAKITVDSKGYATNQASLTGLLKNTKVNDIIVNGKTDFTIPKGNFGKNIESSGKNLSLKIEAGSSLNSLKLSGTENAKIEVLGQLSYLYSKKDNTKINLKSSGKNAIVNSIHLEKPSELDFTSDSNEALCNIFVLAKSDIKISGKNKTKDVIAIKETAEETTITADKNVDLYTDARTTLVVNSGAKDSRITTLNYKTPITVTNNTDSALTVTTPSVEKKVEAGETHTVTGKN